MTATATSWTNSHAARWATSSTAEKSIRGQTPLPRDAGPPVAGTVLTVETPQSGGAKGWGNVLPQY